MGRQGGVCAARRGMGRQGGGMVWLGAGWGGRVACGRWEGAGWGGRVAGESCATTVLP